MDESNEDAKRGAAVFAIGLMSGTSCDGVDCALIRTDGSLLSELREFETIEYDSDLRSKLAALPSSLPSTVADVEKRLTEIHADAVKCLFRRIKGSVCNDDVAVIGFHGHTVCHDPVRGWTVQIGDGALLAERCGKTVVSDFRRRDVACGGEGAPLAPLFHHCLLRSMSLKALSGQRDQQSTIEISYPVMMVNVGGVGNVTFIESAEVNWRCEMAGTHVRLSGYRLENSRLLAFDSGPGNAMIDDWMLRRTGKPLDVNGESAATGSAMHNVVDEWLRSPFFSQRPPKSLDRNTFNLARMLSYLEQPLNYASSSPSLSDIPYSTEDVAATLTLFTAKSIAYAAKHCPSRPQSWLLCGGGRKNMTLMNMLKQALDTQRVYSIDEVGVEGVNGDAIEAQAFAYLAVRRLKGLSTSLPSTTGCDRPVSGGAIHHYAT